MITLIVKLMYVLIINKYNVGIQLFYELRINYSRYKVGNDYIFLFQNYN